MGRGQLVGPATRHIAVALTDAREKTGLTIDALTERAGIARTTVIRALAGETALSVETLIAICPPLGLDAGELLNDAQRSVAAPAQVIQMRPPLHAVPDAADHPGHDAGPEGGGL